MIVVTTRSKEVASTMLSKVYFLEQLQEDDSSELFVKHAFPNSECRDIDKKISKKCKGLPLALKTIGSLLDNKSSVSEWETVFQNDIWELPKDRFDIVPALALSYIHLPPHLKKGALHLRKLKNLKVMMNPFIVGHSKEFGIHRLGELNLDGSISIEELENIENSLDALEEDLKNKTCLVKLKLRRDSRRNIDSKKEDDVIENMQPSKNLKELSIFSYGEKQFPNWLLENSLWNMMSLVLEECESCQSLPPLGLLPFLKDLMG
ncbi:hypothetical protein V8G54_023794 [Vigna mungo]|uniref:R13L1/DRL21-like LRR repeat region domain-containing protein n=1 Tax=Vigna mungo TaxID=3915 RepID=A0AAQ3RRY3_VIGMU